MSKTGRPPKYNDPEELWADFKKYVEDNNQNTWTKYEAIKGGDRAGELIHIPVTPPLSILGFCVFIGITRITFWEYGKKEKFLNVTSRIKDVCERNQVDGAMSGFYNHNLVARLNGIADEQNINVQGDVKALVITPASKLKKDERD